jgi:integrase
MKGSSVPIRNLGKGKRPWLLDLRYIGGGRPTFETRAEAELERKKKLKEVEQHGREALALTTDERIDFVRARKQLEKYGLTVQRAIEFVSAHHGIAEAVPLSVAIERIVKVKQDANKDLEYIRQLKMTLTGLKAFVQDSLVSQITRPQIEQFLFRPNWKPATIRGQRINIKTFFRFALSHHWIASDPSAHIEKIQLEDIPPGILTVEECNALFKSCVELEPDMSTFFALGIFCGLRSGTELQEIRKGDIDLERGFVNVRAEITKSRKRRIVDLSENCKAWLKLGIHSTAKIQYRFDRVIKGASERLGREFKWPRNAMRHSFASYHLAMHQSAEKTALQMGHHSTDMLFRHYRELVRKSDADLFWSLSPSSDSTGTNEQYPADFAAQSKP